MPAEPPSVETVALREPDAGRNVALKPGQQLRITLQETPTTGYRWSLPEPCSHLELQSDTAAGSESHLPGAPGTHTWVFQAKSPGTCELSFHSARSWEKQASGRTLAFPLTIAP